jgi:4-alpha-glucanotransferase
MELSAGAPPDMYFAFQKWGDASYDWFKIAEDGFGYLSEKLK